MVLGLGVKLIHMALCTVAHKSENFISAQMRLAAQKSQINKNTDLLIVVSMLTLL